MNFQIILYGTSGSGSKTSLMERIVDNKFEYYVPTIGLDFKILNIESKYGKIKLQIWDLAGQERFRNVVKNYFKRAHCIILGYDITDKESFDD